MTKEELIRKINFIVDSCEEREGDQREVAINSCLGVLQRYYDLKIGLAPIDDSGIYIPESISEGKWDVSVKRKKDEK